LQLLSQTFKKKYVYLCSSLLKQSLQNRGYLCSPIAKIYANNERTNNIRLAQTTNIRPGWASRRGRDVDVPKDSREFWMFCCTSDTEKVGQTSGFVRAVALQTSLWSAFHNVDRRTDTSRCVDTTCASSNEHEV